MTVSSMNVSAVAPEGYDVNNDGRVISLMRLPLAWLYREIPKRLIIRRLM